MKSVLGVLSGDDLGIVNDTYLSPSTSLPKACDGLAGGARGE